MSDWKEFFLEDVASDFAMGPFGSNIKAENFVDEGVPVIRGKNMNFAKYIDGEFVYLTEEKANELSRSCCYPGDLVFTHRGTIGQVCLVPNGKFSRYVVSQSGMKATVDEKKLNADFLFYFFKSDIGQHELLQNESQVGVPAISSPLTSLKAVRIKLPPLLEQKAIAAVLSSLDDKIDLLHRQNKTLEAMAETLFRQWFVEEADEGWEEVALGDLVESINGVSYKGSELNPSDCALVSLKSFDRNGGFRLDGFKEYTGNYKKNQIVTQGDIAVAHTDITQDAAVIGNPVYIISDPRFKTMVVSMDLVKVEPKNEWLSKEFIYFLLRTKDFKQHCLGFSNGSTVLHLSKNAIPQYTFLIPPKQTIILFSKTVQPLFMKQIENIIQIRTLEKLRDTLLPKLMSGEVRVKV